MQTGYMTCCASIRTKPAISQCTDMCTEDNEVSLVLKINYSLHRDINHYYSDENKKFRHRIKKYLELLCDSHHSIQFPNISSCIESNSITNCGGRERARTH